MGGWRLKAYSIAHGTEQASHALIEAARDLTRERLPSGIGSSNYGVGFVGIHQGRTSNFVFVDWWAEENELHHHVYVSAKTRPEAFECKTGTGLAACVWDLALMAFEREAWVETVLKPGGALNLEGYLSRRMNSEV